MQTSYDSGVESSKWVSKEDTTTKPNQSKSAVRMTGMKNIQHTIQRLTKHEERRCKRLHDAEDRLCDVERECPNVRKKKKRTKNRLKKLQRRAEVINNDETRKENNMSTEGKQGYSVLRVNGNNDKSKLDVDTFIGTSKQRIVSKRRCSFHDCTSQANGVFTLCKTHMHPPGHTRFRWSPPCVGLATLRAIPELDTLYDTSKITNADIVNGAHSRIPVKCRVCDTWWSPQINNIVNGGMGCMVCYAPLW